MSFSPGAGAVIRFTVEGAQTAQRQIETIGDSFDRFGAFARTGLAALAAGFAAWNIGAYAKDASLLAARYETLGIVMRTAGENAGYSGAQMDAYANSLEKSGISMLKAREALIAMTTANLDNNKAVELGRLAQNLAVVANKSSSETLTDLITNIQQADTEGLKHMGIILNQDEALQKYASSHGTVVKALTQTQKAEAVQAAVMEQGAKYAGIYEKALTTAGKALGSLDRYFENIKVRLGTPLLEGFAQGVFGVTDGVKKLNLWLEALETNGSMEKFAKSFGTVAGNIVKGTALILEGWSNILSWVTAGWDRFKQFYDDHEEAMDAIGLAAVAFATVYEGALLLRALPALRTFVAQSWIAAGAQGVVGALGAMSTAAIRFVRAFSFSAALIGFGPAIVAALSSAAAAIGAFVAAAPALVIGAFVALAVGAAAIFSKTFRQKVSEWTGGVLFKMDAPKVEVSDDGKKPSDDPAKAAANKAENDRKEQLMREMNNTVVAAEGQIAITAAANTRLKALNDLRDQQLKQSLDLRIITQADYLQKKEKMDVAEAQGQLDQIAAQKAQLAAYMAAYKAGAPLGQGRDPAADANEMIKLSGDAAAAQAKLNAVKQSYAFQIAGAALEGYTKEFGSVSSLVDAQGELTRSSKQAYELAGKTAEQQEIQSAVRMQSIAQEISAERDRQILNGTATKEYLDSTKAMSDALEQLGAARIKALSKGVATSFINDTKQVADETIALYDAMKNTFVDNEEERVRAAAAASIKLASIRLADANTAIDKTNDSDDQKLAARRKLLADFNAYADAVNANADAKIFQASEGYVVLADTLAEAFDPMRVENFGQVLAGAFGAAGDALGGLLDTFGQFEVRQRAFEQARFAAAKKFKDQPEELAAANAILTARQTKDSLSYYATMASASKGFFKENTAGYRVLEGAEKAFRLVQLAYQMESLYTHLFVTTAKATATTAGQAVETGAVIAGEAERNAAKVPGVFMAFMSALGPWGTAAAAVAIAAVLGGAFSGGGSVNVSKQRQETQGTGTVLGDDSAKSESIQRAIEAVEKNTYQDLAINSNMLATLKSIDSNIGNFASQLVQSTDVTGKYAATTSSFGGGFLGSVASSIFGGKTSVSDTGFKLDATTLAQALAGGVNAMQYTDKHKSGGWFSSGKDWTESKSLGDAANAQFAAIIKSLADSVKQAGSLLGLSGDDFTKQLNSFVIDVGNVSLKDLKGDEVQKALEGVFSKLGDQLAQFAVGGLEKFQQVGEGYLETLVRIASEYQTVDVVFQSFGKTFGAVGVASIEARDRLVQLAGGLDKFTSQGEYFLQNFFSEQEQAAALKKRIDPTLAQYGLSTEGEGASKALRDFIVGLDTTTAAGAQAYTALMALAPAFKQIVDAGQDVLNERKDLQDQLDDLTMSFEQKLAKQRSALDPSNRALFDQVHALEVFTDALDLQGQIAELAGDKAGAAAVLQQQHAAALLALDPALREATQKLWSLQAAAKATDQIKADSTTAFGVVDSMFSALQKIVAREKTAVQASVDAHSASVTKLQSLADSLKSTLSSIQSPDQKMAERAVGQAQIRAALAIARAGGPLPDADKLKDALSAVQQDASDQFSSYQDYLRDLYQTQGDISALAGLTGNALSVEQQALDNAKEQLKSLDGILTSAQEQIDELKGQSTTLISIAQGVAAVSLAIKAAQANPVVAATSSINGAYQQYLGRAPDSAGLAFWQNQAAAGVSASSIKDAIAGSAEAKNRSSIAQLYEQLLERPADDAGLGFFASSGSSLADIAAAIKGSDEYKKLHPFAVGTNFIPEDMPAFVHAGERIIPAADNRELMQRLSSPAESNAALVAEVRALRVEVQALREANSAENRAIAKGTQATADHLEGAVNGDVPFATKVLPA